MSGASWEEAPWSRRQEVVSPTWRVMIDSTCVHMMTLTRSLETTASSVCPSSLLCGPAVAAFRTLEQISCRSTLLPSFTWTPAGSADQLLQLDQWSIYNSCISCISCSHHLDIQH